MDRRALSDIAAAGAFSAKVGTGFAVRKCDHSKTRAISSTSIAM
jgi:hypothetical protein